MDDLLDRAHQLRLRGESFALATVVRVGRPASARPGMKAIVLVDGTLEGWVGGSCTHPVVIREALVALRSGTPRLISLSAKAQEDQREGVIHHLMTCHSGGSLEIYIEPMLPRPQLLLIGEAPLVGTLADLGKTQGFGVRIARAGEAVRESITGSTYVVIATMGAYDEEALEQVVGSPAAYIALVSSRKRAEVVFEYLRSRGASAAQLQAIKVPAGLDIGAVTPEEIALSIMAEISKVRRASLAAPFAPHAAHVEKAITPGASASHAVAKTAAPVPGREAKQSSNESHAPDMTDARDPICGMRVRTAGARYTSDYQGVRFYFCSASCKATFDADPVAHAMV